MCGGKLSDFLTASANRIYAKQINSNTFIKKTYKNFCSASGLLYNSAFLPYNEDHVCHKKEIGVSDD